MKESVSRPFVLQNFRGIGGGQSLGNYLFCFVCFLEKKRERKKKKLTEDESDEILGKNTNILEQATDEGDDGLNGRSDDCKDRLDGGEGGVEDGFEDFQYRTEEVADGVGNAGHLE